MKLRFFLCLTLMVYFNSVSASADGTACKEECRVRLMGCGARDSDCFEDARSCLTTCEPRRSSLVDKLRRRQDRSAAWDRLATVVVSAERSAVSKKAAIIQFMVDHPLAGAHFGWAISLLNRLERSAHPQEISSFVSRIQWHSQTEWFGLAVGFGVYGLDVGFDLFTIRRPHFYWTILRASLTTVPRKALFFHGGILNFGGSIPLNSGVKRELRIGLGLEIGAGIEGINEVGCGSEDGDADCAGINDVDTFFIVPELSYHWQTKGTGFRLGIKVHFFTISALELVFDSELDASFPPGRYPWPHLMVAFGFAL